MARRWWLLLAGVPAAAALWFAGAAESVPISIRLFGYDRVSGDVVAYSDGPLESKGFPLREPDRWVVDIPNAVYSGALKTLAAVPGSGIRQIRIGQFTRSDVRVVFDLEQAMEIPVRAEQRHLKTSAAYRLVFDLPSLRPATDVTRAKVPGAAAKTRPAPPAEAPRKVRTATVPASPSKAGVPADPTRSGALGSPIGAGGLAGPSGTGVSVGPSGAGVSSSPSGTGVSSSPSGAGVPAGPATEEPRHELPGMPPAALQPLPLSAPQIAQDPPSPWGWLGGLIGAPPAEVAGDVGHMHDPDGKGEEPKPVPVSGLKLRRAGKGWIMRITADKPIDYKLARMGRRDRIYLDLLGGTVDIPRESMYVDNGLMARVKKGAMQDNATRVVLELDQPLRYEAHLSADRRAVILALSRSEPRAVPGTQDDRITIDPGHGGIDPGTIGQAGTLEKTVTLAVAGKVSALLEKAGMDVQMTRNRDQDLLLWPRVDMGDEFKSDAFVSIHMNSSPNRATTGIETYYFTPESIPLARSIHRNLVGQLGAPDRGIRRANFVVVKYSRMPAVLVEVGYLSNLREEGLLINPEYQQRAADAIKVGVQDFLKQRTLARQ
ncbi:MAG: N-acetylmuramoyl-L-alanine amidase [Candidatus Sericytochromatia bacterium]|nr:N-acetylmuramoyl-L-alanine amidase [Candidatus Tanganyikabacteria bacterium]